MHYTSLTEDVQVAYIRRPYVNIIQQTKYHFIYYYVHYTLLGFPFDPLCSLGVSLEVLVSLTALELRCFSSFSTMLFPFRRTRCWSRQKNGSFNCGSSSYSPAPKYSCLVASTLRLTSDAVSLRSCHILSWMLFSHSGCSFSSLFSSCHRTRSSPMISGLIGSPKA